MSDDVGGNLYVIKKGVCVPRDSGCGQIDYIRTESEEVEWQ